MNTVPKSLVRTKTENQLARVDIFGLILWGANGSLPMRDYVALDCQFKQGDLVDIVLCDSAYASACYKETGLAWTNKLMPCLGRRANIEYVAQDSSLMHTMYSLGKPGLSFLWPATLLLPADVPAPPTVPDNDLEYVLGALYDCAQGQHGDKEELLARYKSLTGKDRPGFMK